MSPDSCMILTYDFSQHISEGNPMKENKLSLKKTNLVPNSFIVPHFDYGETITI